MEIEQLKLRLIQLVLEIDNQEVLLKVLEILQNFEVKTDPWNELSEEVQNDIEEALQEVENGEVIPHNEALKLIPQKHNLV